LLSFFIFLCYKAIHGFAGKRQGKTTLLPVDCDKRLLYIYTMKHISILILKEATLTSIDSTLQLFTRINDFLKYQGRPPYYTIELIGATKSTALNNGSFYIRADKTLEEVTKTNLVILPMICGDFVKAINSNKDFYGWIENQYAAGAEIASLCTGSFVLASTGILNTKKCAVHWAAANDFTIMFPGVTVAGDKIMTDENGIYTSGGGYSYLNLLLYLVEKHLGREFSVLASKMFEIDIERSSQNSFAIFMGQKQHGDSDVLTAQEFIENNYTEKFTVDELSTKCGVGRRTFERKFKKLTGNSFMQYAQRVKVEAAKKQLETGKKTINEIIYEIGYNDINAFREVFKKYTGFTPIEYRNKYKARQA